MTREATGTSLLKLLAGILFGCAFVAYALWADAIAEWLRRIGK